MDTRHKIATRFAIAGFLLALINKLAPVTSGEYYISNQTQFWLVIILNSILVIGLWYAISYGILTLLRNRKFKKSLKQPPLKGVN
jgi:hypothetical protein